MKNKMIKLLYPLLLGLILGVIFHLLKSETFMLFNKLSVFSFYFGTDNLTLDLAKIVPFLPITIFSYEFWGFEILPLFIITIIYFKTQNKPIDNNSKLLLTFGFTILSYLVFRYNRDILNFTNELFFSLCWQYFFDYLYISLMNFLIYKFINNSREVKTTYIKKVLFSILIIFIIFSLFNLSYYNKTISRFSCDFNYRQKVIIKSQNEGLNAIKAKNSKYGYKDATGKYVILPIYDFAFDFSDGMAAVSEGKNKWGYINKSGKYVIKPQYSTAYSFVDGYAIVTINNKWGMIDKTGKIIITPKYEQIGDFKDGLAYYLDNGLIGFLDKNGNEIIPPQFKRLGSDFSEGLASISLDGKTFGYIDKSGKYAIKPMFKRGNSFYKGKAVVIIDDKKYANINKSGDFLCTGYFP